MTEVDLSQLAIDRSESPGGLRLRRHLITRFILPGILTLGFLGLIAWAARDLAFPPRDVRVVPVLATRSMARTEGTPLFNAAGWIEPRPTAIRVAALASGVVEKLLVVEDQWVTAGEPIAELVKDDARLGYDRSIADRQLAEAGLDHATAQFVAAKTRFEQPVHLLAALAEADTDLAKINTMLKNLPFETQRADARLRFAKRDYERNLSAAASVSHREIDAAKTAYETAQATLQELKDRKVSLDLEASAIRQRREAVNIQTQLLADEIQAKDEAEASVKVAHAKIQQMTVAESEAELRLKRMTIRAPVDGRIFRLIGLPGARVGEGVMTAMAGHDGGTIVTMYQPSSLQIRVDVRFEDIPKVSLNQPVRIDNDALPQSIIGRVLFISSEADIQKNTLQVKVAIDAASDFFKPEMLVDVTFLAPKTSGPIAENQQVLRIYAPVQWVEQDQGQAFVWLADQSAGIAHRQLISLGATSNEGLVEVVEGLSLDSRIITSGTDGLAEGDRIRITGEDHVN